LREEGGEKESRVREKEKKMVERNRVRRRVGRVRGGEGGRGWAGERRKERRDRGKRRERRDSEGTRIGLENEGRGCSVKGDGGGRGAGGRRGIKWEKRKKKGQSPKLRKGRGKAHRKKENACGPDYQKGKDERVPPTSFRGRPREGQTAVPLYRDV